jgi:hypothetical protein
MKPLPRPLGIPGFSLFLLHRQVSSCGSPLAYHLPPLSKESRDLLPTHLHSSPPGLRSPEQVSCSQHPLGCGQGQAEAGNTCGQRAGLWPRCWAPTSDPHWWVGQAKGDIGHGWGERWEPWEVSVAGPGGTWENSEWEENYSLSPARSQSSLHALPSSTKTSVSATFASEAASASSPPILGAGILVCTSVLSGEDSWMVVCQLLHFGH